MTPCLPATIQTERLLLRPPQLADAAALFAAYTQDAGVAHYMTWTPHVDLAQTQAFLEWCVKAWEGGLCLPYVVTRQGDTTAIGMLEARLQGHCVDLGYVLGRAHWRQGYMSEAISAFSEAALALPPIYRLQATCDMDNFASARTLEKSGFRREGLLASHTIHPNISAEPRACFIYARCRDR